MLPVNESTWLVQPITVTVSKFDYDITQTKFLVAIIEGLQESIKQSITKKVDQLPLFSDGQNEDELTMKIPLKNLGIQPKRYPEIKQSLIKLATTPFEMPVKDENGKKYNRYSGLCEVYIPDEKYVRHVMVKIKKDIAYLLIDAKVNGYQKYLKQVVTNAQNKYTQRMYLYITSWKDKGVTEVKVDVLRAFLQMGDKYPRWRAFNTNVIKKAETELRKSFEEGLSECCFTAEPIYLKAQRGGEPDKIRFYIEVSQEEKANMEASNFYNLKMKADMKLLHSFGIKTKRKREHLLKLLDKDNIHTFTDFLAGLEVTMNQQQALITDKESYANSACMRFLKNSIQEAVVVEEKEKTEEDETGKLFNKELAAYKKAIKKEVGEAPYRTWIEPIAFKEIIWDEDGYMVLLGVPSKFFMEMIEEKYIKPIVDNLAIALGKPIKKITYRLGR